MPAHSLRNGASVLALTSFADECMGALYDLRWMLVLAAVLIAADFWFGIQESIHRHQEFRLSRAGRRTANKFVDYVLYLMLGALIGLAITEPCGLCSHVQTAAFGMGLGCMFELDSIVGHVCAVHGVKKIFSVKRFFVYLLCLTNKNIGDAAKQAFQTTKE